MNIKSSVFILSAAFILVMWTPNTSMAINRIVVSDSSLCSDVTSPDVCYTSAQTAITDALAATTSDSIQIYPGTYNITNITINKADLSIQGTETARTILTGAGNTTITLSGVANPAIISNLTFINVGLQVSNGSTVNIKNNVFESGTGVIAIQVNDTSAPVIMNNTFYQNMIAIASTPNSLSIINNIFSNNSLAISNNVLLPGIKNNLFFANTNIGPDIVFNVGDPGYLENIAAQDPLFVNVNPTTEITKRDFHLKLDPNTNSNPAKDTGDLTAGNDTIDPTSPPDIGAYGGSNSDTIPFPVQNLVSSKPTPDSTTVHLTWDSNLCYQVTGYTIHYGTAANSLTITINAGNVTVFDVTGLSPASAPTGTAELRVDNVASNTLQLSWTTGGVTGATGYEVRYVQDGPPTGNTCPYSTIPTSGSPSIDAQNATSYPLAGLDNDTCYSVIVVPYALATYYFAVTAHYANPAFKSTNSNIENQQIGDTAYDTDTSNVIHDFPEAITPYPNLPNKGCFIATAAYGYYSAPQVQALRTFRDRYLITNAPGRAFVDWYYTYGPIAAQFINEHPGLKPAVRVALLPAAGGAMFMTRTSALTKMCALAFIGLLGIGSVWVYPGRKNHRPR